MRGAGIRYGWGCLFVCALGIVYIPLKKKIDSGFGRVHKVGMPDPIKQKYYLENREKRLAYQKAYYERHKALRPRRKELEEFLEPEEYEARKQARSAYNRDYYLNNRARICKQRAAFRIKKKQVEQEQVTEG